MASEHEIAKGLETLLRESDPSSVTTLNDVVHHLGDKLGVDLSHKVDFVRDQIDLLLRRHPQPPPPPSPPKQQIQFPSKDHFALHHHHHPQFASARPQQQFPSHFAHYPLRHDLNFSQPQHLHQPPRGPAQLQQLQVKKSEALPQNALENPKESAPAVAKRKGGSGGLNKVCGVSPELQAVVGEPALPRTEIVKQLWAYIRKNNLQDPSNKRKIICDDALRVLFETDCTDMFKMNKLLTKHIIRLEPSKESSQAKRPKADVESTLDCTKPMQPPASSPMIISEALAKFLGIEGREMLQSEALQRVWEYIKSNHLEDPVNPMVILCDAKLRELLGCESISALGISEMLARHHLFKRS